MRQMVLIAGKEWRDGLRNRWVVAVTLLLALFALTLSFLGAAPTGSVKASPLAVTIVSLSSLSIFLLPLIALLLSYDAIVGEWERGTLALLLAYPVARWQVVLGKFSGQVGILAVATALGYSTAGAAAIMSSADFASDWGEFAAMLASSVLLGAVFIALGQIVSAVSRDRGTAGGIAIGIWLVFVLVYDMALLGVLVADHGRVLDEEAVGWLLLFNPADIYRLFNLGGTTSAGAFSGMSGLAAQAHFGPGFLISMLLLWCAVPLVAAVWVFSRRQI